jgi:hypothetical protein
MNWIGIAVGAGAGVVAVLISAGIMRLLGKANTKGASILHVVVFAVALALGREVVEPRIQAQQVESKLLEMPIYRAIQQFEPDSYKKILTALEQGIANKQPLEQMWSVTRPVVGEVTIRRLPHASDPVLIKFASHVVSATTLLHSKGGNACFSYISPAPGEALDFTAILGKDVAQQELDLVAEVVTSAAGKTRPPVAEADAAPDIEAVISKLLKKYTESEIAGMQNLQTPGIDKRKYCLIIADLYAEATALPEPRNSRLVRYLMQSQ